MRCHTIKTSNGNDVVYPWLIATDVIFEIGRLDAGSVIPFNVRLSNALEAKAIEDGGQELDETNPVAIRFADLATNDPLRFIPERSESSVALVHLAPTVPRGGRLFYEDNAWQAEVVGGRRKRVRRTYGAFPSVGIEIVALGNGPNDEPQALIKMLPGASFRICRKGYRGGLPPENVVTWTGSMLRIITPAKYDKAKAPRSYADATA